LLLEYVDNPIDSTNVDFESSLKAATTPTAAIPRSNYTTINKVQQEEIRQQPGPITTETTTTIAQLPKQPSKATTTMAEDQSSSTNKKETQKEAIATSKEEEAIRRKVLAVPSEPATNGSSGIMVKPPITKEESKISPVSSSSTPSTIPLSETTPTNVSVEEEPSEKIVAEKAAETAAEKAVTKAEVKVAAPSISGNMKLQHQDQEQSMEQAIGEQTLFHVEKEEDKEDVPPNVEVTVKPPHNIEFSPPISAVNVPKPLEESGMSATETRARQDKQYFSNEIFPLSTIMALWQYSIIDGIKIYNEFATKAAKTAEYWFDVFWNPEARRQERKEKVVVR
jgi:hypothetical protein